VSKVIFRKNPLFLVSAALVIFSLSGCGKSTAASYTAFSQHPSAHADPATLDGLPTEALLQTKYDRATLDCKARLLVSKTDHDVGVSDSNPSSASWNLLNEYSDMKTLSFKVSDQGMTYDIQVMVNKIDIETTALTIGNENYQLTESPVLDMNYIISEDLPFGVKGNLTKGTVQDFNQPVYENIRSPDTDTLSYTSTAPPGSDSQVSVRFNLSCRFNTKLKPAYQDEWQKLN